MKILINASNIKVGGALQVASSLISSLINNDRGNEIYFVVSSHIVKQLPELETMGNVCCLDIRVSSPLGLISARSKLDSLTLKFKPDVVFSVFGPGYWRPTGVKHLVGFANAWIVTPNTIALKKLSLLQRLFTKLKYWILGSLLYNVDDFYVTETDVVKRLFCVKFNVAEGRVGVVSNGLPYFFNHENSNHDTKDLAFEGFKFLTVSHNYPHKNLDVIPLVGKELDAKGVKCKFVVTFDSNTYESMSSDFKYYTINAGVVDQKDCRSLYQSCQALFLPTLIECFTASYLEAMEVCKPILTSDLSFAHDICGDSAYYFDPLDISSISNVCSYVINNYFHDDMRKKLHSYQSILPSFPNQEEKVDGYISYMKKIVTEY